MLNYKKDFFVENVYYLCEQNNIMIGQLEKEILGDSSIGFFSRLRKDNNDKKVSVEMISLIASKFNLLIDVLIGLNLKEMTETERYITNFINRLIIQTNNRDLVWESETIIKIMSGNSLYTQYNHPLIDRYKAGYYNSQFFSNGEDVNPKNIYYFISADCVFYFVNSRVVKKSIVYDAFEMYVYKNDISKVYCSINEMNDILYSMSVCLKESIDKYLKSPRLCDEAKNAIDDFMCDLPF